MNSPEHERARLAGVYFGMSDQELLKIANSGDDLTPSAQEVFSAEIARRGLDPASPPRDDFPEEEPEPPAPIMEQERARLAELYCSMNDGELEELAASGFDLSKEALNALESEIANRGLDVAIASPPGFYVPELSDIVLLRQFRDLPEALLAKGSLESAGIQAYLVDDNMIRMDWFISNLLGGIKLKVHAADAATANEILDQPIPESVDVEGVGEYVQPRCPRCQSLDISFQELNKLLSYGSAYVGIPVPVQKKTWNCHACCNEWEEGSNVIQEDDGASS